MDLNRKLELVQQSVKSISTHEDIDAAVRLAALARIGGTVKAESEAINARIEAEIVAKLPKDSTGDKA